MNLSPPTIRYQSIVSWCHVPSRNPTSLGKTSWSQKFNPFLDIELIDLNEHHLISYVYGFQEIWTELLQQKTTYLFRFVPDEEHIIFNSSDVLWDSREFRLKNVCRSLPCQILMGFVSTISSHGCTSTVSFKPPVGATMGKVPKRMASICTKPQGSHLQRWGWWGWWGGSTRRK